MASHPDKVLRSECDTHRRNSLKREGRGSRDSSHTVKIKSRNLSASDNDGSLNMPVERTLDVPQSASVKSAKRYLTITKASAPPMDS